ncbi:MAG: DUF373 family protein [Candidatus Anstonellales archaeon]
MLVIATDVDNDLWEKAKVKGPVFGREENLKAATRMALADPEDPDANVMFKAINIYDEIKKREKDVEIVTLTGDKSLGIRASREIAKQLDKVLKTHPSESCVVVSDGAGDETIMHVIKSRMKVEGNVVVFVKQAKELEKTYFVILEKLKDPYYAKIIFGIPALIILLISIMFLFNIPWQYLGIVIGTYLVLKGFGVDERIAEVFGGLQVSKDRAINLIFITGISALSLISLWMAYQAYIYGVAYGLIGISLYAYTLDAFVLMFSWVLIILFVIKMFDAFIKRFKFEVLNNALYISVVLLSTMIIRVGAKWITNISPPYVSFADFLLTIIIAGVAGYATSHVIGMLKTEVISSSKLENKEVYDEEGSYIGKAIRLDEKHNELLVLSPVNKKQSIPAEEIVEITEKIVVKS